MLKLEVFRRPVEEPDEPVRLALQKAGNSIWVIAVDRAGRAVPGGYLADFTPSGRLYRRSNISHDLGFDLDDRGRIRTRAADG